MHFRERQSEGIRTFGRVYVGIGQMGFQFAIEAFVVLKFAVPVHQAMCEHEELELLVMRIGDKAVAQSGKRGVAKLHESNNQRAGLLRFLHRFYHLGGCAAVGCDHNHGLSRDMRVAVRGITCGMQ